MTDDTFDALCESLQSLRPARDQMDVRQVFFEAGKQAARPTAPRAASIPMIPMLAAGLTAVVLVAPIAFLAGTMRSPSRMEHVVADSASSPVRSPADTSARDQALLPEPPLRDKGLASPGDGQDTNQRKVESPPAERHSPSDSLFARWMNLEAVVTALQLERASQPTLSVSHASLISRVSVTHDLADMLFTLAELPDVRAATSDQVAQESLTIRPLSVGSRSFYVSGLEGAQ